MADYPFIIPLNLVVAANSTGTATFTISSSETMKINRILATGQVAGLNIQNIRDGGGRGYMPSGASGNIPSLMLGGPSQANMNNPLEFIVPLELPSQGSLLIDVQNTTGGSLTINLAVIGVKTPLGG